LSHSSFYEKKLRLCIKILLDNGYPLDFIFNRSNLKLKKLFIQRSNNAIDVLDTNSINERKILVLPYVQPLSKFISANIDKSKANICFCCLNKLSLFIKAHKDIDHISFKNNVVFKIGCNNCDATYVKQTKRQLRTIKEELRKTQK